MLNIIILFLCIGYILYCLDKGCRHVQYTEKVCTEKIEAKIKIIKTKRFFTKKYYIVNVLYSYDNKNYAIRKGFFKNDCPDTLNVFINPKRPEECEVLRIKERICG